MNISFIKNKLLFALLITCGLNMTACGKLSKTPTNNHNDITKHSVKNKDNTLHLLNNKYKKAYVAFFNHKHDETIKIADEIIKKDTTFYKAYNIKGIALCFLGDFQNGMKNIDQALSINPNFGYARFNKALGYELYGHYTESLNWYDKALQVENYIWSYYGKASIYGRLGDVKNAVKYLKIAIDMDDNIKKEAKYERDFDKVRNNLEFKKLVEQ